MPVMDGIEATRRIVDDDRLADVQVVMLTNYGLDEHVFNALRAGASGFVLKDTEPADLLQALRVTMRGDALLSPAVTRRLISEFVARPATVLASADLDAAHQPGARGRRAGGARAQQRRDRRADGAQPDDGEDPRQPSDDQARRARPGAARRVRLPVRAGQPGG